MGKYLSLIYKVHPAFFILFLNFVFVFLSLPFNFPLLIMVIVVLSFNLLLGFEKGYIFSAFSLPVLFGILSFISHIIARLGCHGYLTSSIILLTLLILSSIVLFWKRTQVFSALSCIYKESSAENVPINIAWTVFALAFWLYSLKFWYVSWDNSLHASYLQMAQQMLETGHFRFLLPREDVPIIGNWWYPNMLSHVLTVFGVWLGKEGMLHFNASLGSFLTLWGLSGVYLILDKDKNRSSLYAITTIIIALFCSYSFFKIGPELSSDTSVFIFLPAFYYFLSESLRENKPGYFYFALATAFFSFWFRFNVALSLLLTLFIIYMISPQARNRWKQILLIRPLVSLLLISVIILIGALWPIEVFRLTGNPLHMHGYGTIFKQNKYSVTFDSLYLKENIPDNNKEKPFASHIPTRLFSKNGLKQLLYHFLAITPEALRNHDWYRMVRGIFVGLTFSAFLTLISIIGLFLSLRHIRELSLLEMISGSILISLLAMVILGNFHYKFLYPLFLPVIIFGNNAIFFAEGKIRRFSLLLMAVFLFIFVLAFLMMGMGLERRQWAVGRCLVYGPKPQCYVKDFYHYSVATELRKYVSPQDKILYFQPEPGFPLNFYLGLRRFNEELTYQSIDTKALHAAKSEEEVVGWLREHQVKLISFSDQPLEYYAKSVTAGFPELLPKMLLNKSGRFCYLGPHIAVIDWTPAALRNNPVFKYWLENTR